MPLTAMWPRAFLAQVLLLSGGEDGAVVAGARTGSTDLAPGEVELRGPAGAVVRLCRDGTVRINGSGHQ